MILTRNCSDGYQLGSDHMVVNHLLCLDIWPELLLWYVGINEKFALVSTVKMFSTEICMKFGQGKCAILSIERLIFCNYSPLQMRVPFANIWVF